MSIPKDGKRPAKESSQKKGTSSTIGIDVVTHRQLAVKAKELNMTKGEYASAAIAYFTQSGFDPREKHLLDGPLTRAKVGEGVANVRAHNADIGNRLFALTRSFERTLFLFMQQQQLSLHIQLEAIESNLLRHQVSVETNLLGPLIEQVFKASVEANVGRIVGEQSYLRILGKPADEWKTQNALLNGERDQLLTAALREFKKEYPQPTPRPTTRPGITPVPPKPVAASPTEAAPAVAPKS